MPIGGQAQPESLRDGARHTLLDLEQRVQRAAVLACPEVGVTGGVNQLGADPQPPPGLADASLDDVLDVELACQSTDVLVGALERHSRGSRDHPKRRQPGNLRDDLLGKAVRQVTVLPFLAQVVERHDEEAGSSRRECRLRIGDLLIRYDQAVAAFRNRLDVRRAMHVVVEGLADLGDSPCQALLCDVRIRPDGCQHFVTRGDLA